MSAFKGSSSSASLALAQRCRQSDAAVELTFQLGRGTHATSRDALPREAAAAVQHCLGARVCEALPARTGRTDGQKRRPPDHNRGRGGGLPSLLARCRVRSTGRAAGSGRQRPGTPVVVAAVHVGPVSAAGPPLLSPMLHCGRALVPRDQSRRGAESVAAHAHL